MESEPDLVLSILMYDNNPNDIEAVREYIKDIEAGWTADFHAAEGPDEFSDRLDARDFHVILLSNVVGPDNDGISVLESLRNRSYDRPIILLAEDGSESLVARTFRKGGNDYLKKEELSPSTLKRSLEYVLNDYFNNPATDESMDKFLLTERRDSLTEYYNQTGLTRKINSLMPEYRPLTLVLIGATNLEAVNRTHGQATGNEVIRTLGEEIEDFFEKAEVMGRIQGSDYCLALPELGKTYAIEQAEEFLEKLMDVRFNLSGENTVPLNFKSCVVQCSDHSGDGEALLNAGLDQLHKMKSHEGGQEVSVTK